MGNKFCCEEEPKKEFDHTITVIHKQPKPEDFQQKEQQPLIQIPDLTPIVAAHLSNKRPYFEELPSSPPVRKFGDDIYSGEIDDRGRPHGYGTMYHKSGSVFIGQFIAGQANGNGHFVNPDGSYYHGKVKNNQANDEKGFYWCNSFEYHGNIVENQIDGEGFQKGLNHTFEGIYKKGSKVKGVLKWNQQLTDYVYEGEFNEEGNFEGIGSLEQKGKGTYTGGFLNGKKHGKGQFKFESGSRYIGYYLNDKKEGEGKLINKVGVVAYEGNFKDGLPHGKGKAPNQKGELIQRDWVDGLDKILIQE